LNRSVTINVLSNDTTNGTLTRPLSIVRFQRHGVASVVNNQIAYTPSAGFCGGNDTLSYEICNANGCDTADVIIAVSCDTNVNNNRRPVAVDDRTNTVLNRSVTINVLSNDTTNGTLTRPLSIVRFQSRGVASVVNNQIAYTPSAGFCGGNDTLSYEICNANGCDTADVIITVSCDTNVNNNRRPVAVDDRTNTVLNRSVTINVLSNDTTNGTLTRPLSIVRFQSRGVASVVNNQIAYTPSAGFCGGNDTLSYEICNANGCDTADVIIAVSCDTNVNNNRRPVAVDDRTNTVLNRSVTINVLSNDTTNGTLTRPLSIVRFQSRGVASVVNNQIAYTPSAGFCGGNDTLSYEICNANGCDTADVIITVSCDTNTNRRPVAVDDRARTVLNRSVTINVLSNDTTNGTLTRLLSIVRFQSRGAASVVNNQIVYIPSAGLCGTNDTLSYEICNANGCDTAEVIIEVSCDTSTLKPIAVNDTATTLLNRSVTISVLANDTLNGVLARPLSITRSPRFGSVSVNATNQVVYTPFPNACGANDTLSYEICNANGCDTADVVVRVECDSTVRNRLPVAVDDVANTRRGRAVRIVVLANDTINGALATIEITRQPRSGRAVLGNDNVITYTPDTCGKSDSLAYRICNANGCDTANVVIAVSCDTSTSNRPPIAVNDTASTLLNRAVTISILANDTLNGTLIPPVTIVRTPRFGTPTVNANNQIVYTPFPSFCGANDTLSYAICNANGCDTADVVVRVECDSTVRNRLPVAVYDSVTTRKNTPIRIVILANDTLNGRLDSIKIIRSPLLGTAVLGNDNVITYIPDSCGFVDSLVYRICNPNGCDTAVVKISVSCADDSTRRPVAVNDSVRTFKNQPLSINVVGNDSLFGRRLDTLRVITQPRRGTATVNNNQIVYTPQRDSCDYRDTLSYEICTRNGCDTADVSIFVACQSPSDTLPPIANFDTASGSRRRPLSIAVLLNDSVRGADTFRITRQPRNGTAAFSGLSLVYTPDTTKCGRDTLIYQICNRRGCDTAIVFVNITCDSLNLLPPIANNDTTITLINESVKIPIFANDTLRGSQTFEVLRAASRGIVVIMPDTNAMYMPDREFCGLDSFTYRICNTAGCDTAFVLIRISCGDTIRVFNGFSPNNDGRNDGFVIRGIENYPENEVIIWNRWGNEVFRKKGYRNDSGFDGTWNGKILPDGTYFFCILLNDGTSDPIRGYVQILR
jgi:gliding motility-associated-like protein